jgi:hypothetical protein
VLAELMDGADIGMVERKGLPRFAFERCSAFGSRLVDATTAAQVRAPQAPQSSTVTNEKHDKLMGLRDRRDGRLIHRRGFPGLRSPHN